MADEGIDLAQELKKRLQEGIVSFTFKKKDGEVRLAKGTTKIDMIPESKRPVEKTLIEGTTPSVSSFQTYFDTDKEAWRSFVKNSLVSID